MVVTSESSCGAGASFKTGDPERPRRFREGSIGDNRIRFTEGSQSEQSEQYETSLLHGDGARWETGEGGSDGE